MKILKLAYFVEQLNSNSLLLVFWMLTAFVEFLLGDVPVWSQTSTPVSTHLFPISFVAFLRCLSFLSWCFDGPLNLNTSDWEQAASVSPDVSHVRAVTHVSLLCVSSFNLKTNQQISSDAGMLYDCATNSIFGFSQKSLKKKATVTDYYN